MKNLNQLLLVLVMMSTLVSCSVSKIEESTNTICVPETSITSNYRNLFKEIRNRDFESLPDSKGLLINTGTQEIVVEVIDVGNLFASEFLTVLRPMMTNGAAAMIVRNNNSLIIVETKENMARIRSLVSKLNSRQPIVDFKFSINKTNYNICTVDIKKGTDMSIVNTANQFLTQEGKILLLSDNSLLLMERDKNFRTVKAVVEMIK